MFDVRRFESSIFDVQRSTFPLSHPTILRMKNLELTFVWDFEHCLKETPSEGFW